LTFGGFVAVSLLDGCLFAVSGRYMGVVYSVGAFDSFQSALLAGLNEHGLLTRDRLAKLDVGVLKILLDRAVAAAAITCSRAGANPPTKRELEDALSAG
jgi:fructokinase